MRKALRLATAERPGAVHLTIPDDVSSQVASDVSLSLPPLTPDVMTVSVRRSAGGSDPHAMLARAKRPVLLAGIAATRARATQSMIRLAEKVSMPVVVSPMSKGVFPEDHALFAGVIDMACNKILWQLLAEADLIIAAGFDAVELIKPWSVSTPVLHIDATPNTDQIYAAQCECVGDVGAVLDWLSEEWKSEPRWSDSDVQAHRNHLRKTYRLGRVTGRLNPTDVVDITRAAAPRSTIATTDVGSHKLLVGQDGSPTIPARCS